MEENSKEKSPDFEVCPSCGAVLDGGSAFCRRCGAKIADAVKKSDGASAPTTEAPAASTAGTERNKFCMNCGAELEENVKFCRKCGTAVGDTPAAAPEAAPVSEADAAEEARKAKRRKLSGLFYLIGAGISIVFAFIFICTPFMSLSLEMAGVNIGPLLQQQGLGNVGEASQNGLTLIGVMFGAKSDLVDMGVNRYLLQWAGWLYVVYILAMVEHGVCLALNVKGYKKGERPFKMLASSASMMFAGLAILIVGCIARSQAGDFLDLLKAALAVEGGAQFAEMLEFSSYLGFVGVFVMSLVGFGCTCFANAWSSKTYPPKPKTKVKAKKTGNERKFFFVDLLLGVLVIAAAIAPVVQSFSSYDKKLSVRVDDKGSATIRTDDRWNGMYAGTTVFRLEDLGYGNSYTFRIETNDVAQSALVGSIALVHYDKVKGKSAAEIMDDFSRQDLIDYNSESETGNGYAYLTFTNDYEDEIAIVVGFAASGTTIVNYDYSLTRAYGY